MKTYIYTRVSTEAQNFTQQLNAINNYLNSKGLKIDELVSEEGVSGAISYKERKLNCLLNEMMEGDALVVSEISRLGRSMCDLNKLINDELKPRKLRLIVISMGLDLDCSNLRAIDEMVLFAFGFAAQIEKEMIQERTRNALESRKKILLEKGEFISQSGKICTKLGSPIGFSKNAWESSATIRRKKAIENPININVWRYLQIWERRNGEIVTTTQNDKLQELCDELNELNYTTSRGLEFNTNRLRAMHKKLKEMYNN